MINIDNYLDENFIKHKKLDLGFYEIDDKIYYKVAYKEITINDEFHLVCFPEEEIICDNIDYFIFEFGERLYFSNNRFKLEFNELKYIASLDEIKMPELPYLGLHGKQEVMNGVFEYKLLAAKAKFLGYTSVGLCERNTLAGAFEFHNDCNKKGLKPNIGITVSVGERSKSYTVKLFAKNDMGWRSLLKVSKIINVDKRQALEIKDFTSLPDVACILGKEFIFSDLSAFQEIFGEDIYYQIDTSQYHSKDYDDFILSNINLFFKQYKAGLKGVILEDAYYLDKDQAVIKGKLNEINGLSTERKSSDQYIKSGFEIYGNFCNLFDDHNISQALFFEFLHNTRELDDKLRFGFEKKVKIPKYKFEPVDYELAPDGKAETLFFSLIADGFKRKVEDKGKDMEAYMKRFEMELDTIAEANLIDYFVITWDMCRYARGNNIQIGLGRGSVGGCLIAYLLDIHEVDPLVYGLQFERFLNHGRIFKDEKKEFVKVENDIKDFEIDVRCYIDITRGGDKITLLAKHIQRGDLINNVEVQEVEFITKTVKVPGSMPDIDLDFESERRPMVKEYFIHKYGKENVAYIGTSTELKIKSLIKDLSRIKGVPFAEVNAITSLFPKNMMFEIKTLQELINFSQTTPRLKEFIHKYPEVIHDIGTALGGIRNKGVHASALIVVPDTDDEGNPTTIHDYVPVREKDGIYITEFSGYELDELGFLKEDILVIKQADKLRRIVEVIREKFDPGFDILNIPLDDIKVLDRFRDGHNQDVFQFNSAGMISLLQLMKVDSLEDLIAANALYRPGPMLNGMHLDYANVKTGKQEPDFLFGTNEILKDTYSVIVYQEQIIEIFKQLGGFSLSEADSIRRAMGKKDMVLMKSYKNQFIEGIKTSGGTELDGITIWDKIERFAEYSFNRAHAVAYAITGYIAQYLKVYYPVVFWAISLEYEADDKEKLPLILQEMQEVDGIKVRSADINKSGKTFYVDYDKKEISWSLISVKGVGEKASGQIIEERENSGRGQFYSFDEFFVRCKKKAVNKATVQNLILAGAFDDIFQVDEVTDRIQAINEFYEKLSADVDPKFLKATKNYHWSIFQKEVSGMAYINFQEIFDSYKIDKPDALEYMSEGEKFTAAGMLNKLTERNSRRGKLASVVLENNSYEINITIWNEQYASKENLLKSNMNQPVLITGLVKMDNYKKKNVINTFKETKILFL